MARRGSEEAAMRGAETIGEIVKDTMLEVLSSGALRMEVGPPAKIVTELTPQGVREVSLAAAGRTHEVLARTTAGYDDAHTFTAEDVIADAKKYEDYLKNSVRISTGPSPVDQMVGQLGKAGGEPDDFARSMHGSVD